MSGWLRIYYKLLNIPLSMLIKSKSITKPTLESGFDAFRPIVYVLPYNSQVDILTLRAQSLICNLPDPLQPLNINGVELPRCIFINSKQHMCTSYILKKHPIKLMRDYLNLHCNNQDLDIQMVLVSIMFGRRPKREKKKVKWILRIPNGLRKFFVIIWLGRDSFVCFSSFISLRQITIKYRTKKTIAEKLIRVARIYFIRQRLVIIGPTLPDIHSLLKKLLVSKTISSAIQDEVRSKQISHKKAQQNAILLIKEIIANFSYEIVRLIDRILNITWNYLYQKVNVYNVERVRQLAYNGYEIVYIPCHRSHMDYLLLSHVLYHHGLALPHIAAGINLNFWPAGPIFRRLGAFFIRRTFKGNKLYSTVFREYLGELFSRGNPVEYFIEGKRSRTGRLLDPKTGTLSMTIQAMLRCSSRPTTFIPIYIGYEHVIEVNAYVKELLGIPKKREGLLQMLRGLCKLRNLGQGYINFGEPLLVMKWLNQHVPEWHKSINPIEVGGRPTWLTPTVNKIATDLMVRINNACTVNAMNLCSTALLASHRYSLTRQQLAKQLECYLDLMRNVPYASCSIVPFVTVSELIDHALHMHKFKVEKDQINDVITLSHEQAVLMTYYRNNIAHMLALPSLIAVIIIKYHRLSRLELLHQIKILYPMLKAELFLRWSSDEMILELDKLINELFRQGLITIKEDELLIDPSHSFVLNLLAAGISETLQRYAIIFWLLSLNPSINRVALEKKSRMLAQHLSIARGINALEFFDKSIFNILTVMLRNNGYFGESTKERFKQSIKVYQILRNLLPPDILSIIERAN